MKKENNISNNYYLTAIFIIATVIMKYFDKSYYG